MPRCLPASSSLQWSTYSVYPALLKSSPMESSSFHHPASQFTRCICVKFLPVRLAVPSHHHPEPLFPCMERQARMRLRSKAHVAPSRAIRLMWSDVSTVRKDVCNTAISVAFCTLVHASNVAFHASCRVLSLGHSHKRVDRLGEVEKFRLRPWALLPKQASWHCHHQVRPQSQTRHVFPRLFLRTVTCRARNGGISGCANDKRRVHILIGS